MHTESDKAVLLEHGLPTELVQAVGETGLPKPLCYGLASPKYQLSTELEEVVPGLGGLIPIFDQNGDAVIGFLPRSNQFVRFYYEDGNEGDSAIEVMATGYVQFASKLILENEEAGLTDYFESLVSFLQFPRGQELRELLDADPYDDEAVERFHAGWPPTELLRNV